MPISLFSLPTSHVPPSPPLPQVLRHDLAVAHPIKRKEHLKHVPDYLVPASMRAASAGSGAGGAGYGYGAGGGRNGKKKRKLAAGQAERRMQQSKLRDPLLNAAALDQGQGDGDGNGEGGEGAEGGGGGGKAGSKVFTASELSRQAQESTSGRRAWKQRHKKGQFNPNAGKKTAHRVDGTFTKSKKYK